MCTFNDGSCLVEEIIEFQEGEGFKMEFSEFSLPLKSMHSEMRVKKVDANTSDLYMSSEKEIAHQRGTGFDISELVLGKKADSKKAIS